MAEELIKKRRSRAIRSAAKILSSSPFNYRVLLFSGDDVHLAAFREKEIRIIRVVLDQISKRDEEIIKSLELPNICSRSILCKRKNKKGFETREI